MAYGGYQNGLPYLTLDPDTGEQVLQSGDPIEVSPDSRHSTFREHLGMALRPLDPSVSLLPYVLPYAAWAAGTGAGAGMGAGAGAGAGGPAASASVASGAAAGAGVGAGTASGVGAGVGAGMGTASGFSRWLPLIQQGGRALSSYISGRDENRAIDNYYDMAYQDAERERALLEMKQLEMDLVQRRFVEDLYDTNVRRSVYGGLLNGIEDVNIQAPAGIPMGNVTGGLRPSAIQNRQQIGEMMQRRSLPELANPTNVAGAPQANFGSSVGWGWNTPNGGETNFNYNAPASWTDASWAQNTERTPGYRPSVKEITYRALNESGIDPATASPEQVISTLQRYGINATSPAPGQIDFGLGEGPIALNGWRTLGNTGQATRLPQMPRIAPSVRPRTGGRSDTVLSGINAGVSMLPSILSLFGGQPQSPRILPSVTAPNPSAVMSNVRLY